MDLCTLSAHPLKPYRKNDLGKHSGLALTSDSNDKLMQWMRLS